MPERLVLILPLLYAVVGAFLWYSYGSGTHGLILWVLAQVCFIPLYHWLIADRSLGLMFRLHVWAMATGMLILFYVLFPGREQHSTGQLVLEVLLMGFGTFCCSVGVFSLIYMLVRKLVADSKQDL